MSNKKMTLDDLCKLKLDEKIDYAESLFNKIFDGKVVVLIVGDPDTHKVGMTSNIANKENYIKVLESAIEELVE